MPQAQHKSKKWDYTYDANGNLTEVIYYNWDTITSTWIFGGKGVYFYSLHEISSVELESELKDINIYPNPTTGILNISGLQNTDIQIYDLTGKLLIDKHQVDNQINVSNLQKGIYTLKITNETGTTT